MDEVKFFKNLNKRIARQNIASVAMFLFIAVSVFLDYRTDKLLYDRAYSAGDRAETMTPEQVRAAFDEHDIAEQFAAPRMTDAQGAPVEDLYACYVDVGDMASPPVRDYATALEASGFVVRTWQGPIPWTKLYGVSEIDLTGRPGKPYWRRP